MRTIVRPTAALLGLASAVAGVWALLSPASFSTWADFPPHRHFVHDIGAFQLGIGVTLLLATIWADALTVALAGYAVGGTAHTVVHVVDRDLGGATGQTLAIAGAVVVAGVAFAYRWRERGWVLGTVEPAGVPELTPFGAQKTVLLTTYRRDGRPVATPVSIAVAGDRAYVRSFEQAWKTRRIGNNPTVTVAASTARGVPTGPAVQATARRLTGPEYDAAARTLRRKYPLLHGVLVPLMHRLGRRRTGRTVHFAIVPAEATARLEML
ncbi:PPOX class F420-dependent oxidoreductase [Micromonospora cremea]|uniref:PPOX class probable F420-dependent enzyme, Rv2061 family n=1 Tax=Micromonospora cremea TaxID=709881 RepID=A0A1N6AMM6_9ACTN|nr:PPOX class F420-dependent oxidoreductase [Micromonospora cremea]SIN35224.1 PPOX class probable F420-dependent enzyme, Rv2061 family [Micromonospora cremea]